MLTMIIILMINILRIVHISIHLANQPESQTASQPASPCMHACIVPSSIHAYIQAYHSFTNFNPVMADLEVRPFGLSSQRQLDPMPPKP